MPFLAYFIYQVFDLILIYARFVNFKIIERSLGIFINQKIFYITSNGA